MGQCKNVWKLETSSGLYITKTVLFATGPITEAQIPRIEGLDTFTGEMFHSAKWNHDYDLTGKRIAVIGTGASAIQFVPQIQPKAKELFVFQRTAPWVLPKPDTDLGELSKSIIAKYPKNTGHLAPDCSRCLKCHQFWFTQPKSFKACQFCCETIVKVTN